MNSNLVRQLFVSNVAAPGLIGDESFTRVVCSKCNVVKYYPHMKGKMLINRKAIPDNVDFIKTYEWFGSGLIAYREILVSNRLAQLILDNNWKGIRLKVVDLV